MRNRLKILRAERNWSQAELAKRLGVSRQTVNAIEREKYDPSLPLAFTIARVFATPIETIFSDGGAHADATPTSNHRDMKESTPNSEKAS